VLGTAAAADWKRAVAARLLKEGDHAPAIRIKKRGPQTGSRSKVGDLGRREGCMGHVHA